MRIALNNHLLNFLLIFICISPNFIFLRKDIWLEDFKYLLVYYVFFIFSYLIFFYLKKYKIFKNLYFFYFSIIIFLGFDKNLKLWLYFQNLAESHLFGNNILNYLISFIFFIIICCFIFIILSNNEEKYKKFILSFVLFFSLFNISSEYFLDMRHKNIEKIFKNNNQEQDKQKNIIIFLDGLVGPGGIDDEIDSKIGVKNNTIDLFKKYNFKLYTNAYSIYHETLQSIPATLNFDYDTNENFNSKTSGGSIMLDKSYIQASNLDKNSTYFLKKNQFFSKNKKKIFATKNRIFNFCNNVVSQCYSLNHNYPSKKIYVSRFESLIKNLRDERAILYQYIWRILILLDFNKEYLFITEKVFFEKDLKDFEKIISNSDFDTYLAFYMFPHSPFILEKSGKKCLFKKYNKDPFQKENSRKAHLYKHYHEIYCGNLMIDKFLKTLAKNNNLDNLNILFISDTGMKIDMSDIKNNTVDGLGNYDRKYLNDAHKVLFAIRKGNSSYSLDNTLISSQELFSKYFNKSHVSKDSTEGARIFDTRRKIFIKFD